MEVLNSNLVEWGVAERRLAGEMLSGDLHKVMPRGDGVLIAVADGLGHGAAAAAAAGLALETVEQCAHQPLVQVLKNCNQKLQRTRGAVLTIAFLNALDGSMEWLGVGDVRGVLVRSMPGAKALTECLSLSSGFIGGKLPPVRAATLKIATGDTLVLVTDGIRKGFEEGLVLSARPQKAAESILRRDGLDTDDALVLVATFQGRAR